MSVADKVWKGKREPDLEQLVAQRLAAVSGQELWAAFLSLDDHLEGWPGRRMCVCRTRTGFRSFDKMAG